jgi:hypothetical protein
MIFTVISLLLKLWRIQNRKDMRKLTHFDNAMKYSTGNERLGCIKGEELSDSHLLQSTNHEASQNVFYTDPIKLKKFKIILFRNFNSMSVSQ